MNLKLYLSELVPLDTTETNVLNQVISHEVLVKGTFYLRAGHICNKVSFINEGLFKMSVADDEGNEKTIEFLGASEFVTDYVSFLNQQATDCDISVLRDATLESINFQDLQRLYSYSANFQKIGRLLAEQNFIRFALRIKSQSLPPQERYKRLCENSNLIQEVPQYMIASYLGVSAEWLSKIRSKRMIS